MKLGNFGAIAIIFISTVAYITRVMKQRRDHRHLCTTGAKAIRRFDTALVANEQAGDGKRHIQRVLHVVIGRVTAFIAGISTSE